MQTINIELLNESDVSTGQYSPVVNTEQMRLISLMGEVTGNIAGRLKIQMSNEPVSWPISAPTEFDSGDSNYFDLPSSGTYFFTAIEICCQSIRAFYDSQNSTQTITTVAQTGATPQFYNILTVADVAGSLNSKYFNISGWDYNLGAYQDYYLWLSINGAGVDPNRPGRIGIKVDAPTNASSATIAANIGNEFFNAFLSGDCDIVTGNIIGNSLDLQNIVYGLHPAIVDGTAPTGFTFSTTTPGTNSNLNNKNFFLTSSVSSIFCFYMNVEGTGVSPAFPGVTNIPVNISQGAQTADAVASAVASTLISTASNFFNISVFGNVVTIYNLSFGTFDPASNGTPATPFTFAVSTASGTLSVQLSAKGYNMRSLNTEVIPLSVPYVNSTSEVIKSDQMFAVSVACTISGPSTGILYLDGSNDLDNWPRTPDPANWVLLSSANIGGFGTTGTFLIPITNICSQFIRVRYENSAGAEQIITALPVTGDYLAMTITTVADVAGSLNNKYFTFSGWDANTQTQINYYVYMDINGAGVDPMLPGKTGIAAAAATNASDVTIATAVASAISTTSLFNVVDNGDGTIDVTSFSSGVLPPAVDGAAPTGFTFDVTQPGVDSNLQNTYFLISDTNTVNKYAIYMSVGGVGADPMVSGYTGAPAFLLPAQSADDVCNAIATAINLINGSTTMVPVPIGNGDLLLELVTAGPFNPAVDGAIPTEFTFALAPSSSGTVNACIKTLGI